MHTLTFASRFHVIGVQAMSEAKLIQEKTAAMHQSCRIQATSTSQLWAKIQAHTLQDTELQVQHIPILIPLWALKVHRFVRGQNVMETGRKGPSVNLVE